jgi:hypothetical protein
METTRNEVVMIRNIVIATALLVPALAHAEIKTNKVARAKTALDVDSMLGKINSTYMQGMQRCYVKGLAQDGSLQGKVSIVFTVNPWGRVSGTVTGIAPKVDNCINGQLASWRFATPRDAKDRPTTSTFKINLLLARQ